MENFGLWGWVMGADAQNWKGQGTAATPVCGVCHHPECDWPCFVYAMVVQKSDGVSELLNCDGSPDFCPSEGPWRVFVSRCVLMSYDSCCRSVAAAFMPMCRILIDLEAGEELRA